MVDRQKRARFLVAYAFVLGFILLVAALGTSAYLYYSDYESHYRVQVANQLSAIGKLKADDLAEWRAERLGNASALYRNAAFASLVTRHFDDPADLEADAELESWLGSLLAYVQYDQVRLLDARGATRLSIPAGILPVSSAISEHLTGVLQSGQVTFLDFYRDDDDGRAYLAVLVPISYGGRSYQALGAVLLRIDPATYLYPYITRWPTPSETAETLLVRRDGNDALFLNELRFRKDTALSLRIPLSSQDVPAVKAISGREGIVEGLDYRGVRVIADVRSVPNSPWFLVARMDAAEVDAPLRERLWQIAAFLGVALAGIGAGLGVLWRHREAGLYRERSEAAKALRESEERLSLALEATRDGVYDVDFVAGTTYHSPGYAAMLGYGSDELPTSQGTWESLLHPDDKESALQTYERSLEGEADDYCMEFRLRTKTGDWRWIQSCGRVVGRDPAGNPLRLVGTHRDITERKLVETALQESEERFRVAQDMSPDGFTVLRPVRDAQERVVDFTWVYENAAIARLSGTDPEAVVGQRLLELFPGHRGSPFLTAYQQVAESGEPYTFEAEYSGESMRRPTWLRIVVVPMRGEIAILAQDITEPKLAENALRESEDRYRSLVGNVPGIIFTMDLAGKITFVGSRIKETLGYESGEVINKSVLDFIPEEERQRAMEAIQKGMTGAGIKHFQTPMMKKTGERLFLECSFTRVRKDGAVIGAQGTAVDITERKQSQAILSESELRYRQVMENASEAIYVAQGGKIVFFNPATSRAFGRSAEDLTGRPFSDLVHPDDRGRVLGYHQARARGEEAPSVHAFRIVRGEGDVRWAEVRVVLVDWLGKPASLCLMSDITEHRQAETERDRLLERQVVLNRVTLALGSLTDLPAVLCTLHGEIRRLVDADGFFVSRYHKDTGLITALFAVDDGVKRDVSSFPPVPLAPEGKGMQSQVLRTGKPLNVPDWIEGERKMQTVYHIARDGTFAPPPPADEREECTKSALLVPMMLQGEPMGVLQVQSNRPSAYSEEDVNLLAGLANVAAISIQNAFLIDEARLSAARIRHGLDGTIQVVSLTTEMRDPYAAGHQRRVSELACAIARKVGLPEERVEGLRVSGLLHDVGKATIPAEILSKPAALTPAEFGLVRAHPQSGYDILKGIDFPWPVADIVREHHERMDGSGYPRGLKAEAISLDAKILAVADVVEAMTSHRPYRPALGIDAALREIRAGRGTRFDAGVVDACSALFEAGQFAFTPTSER